MEKTMEKIVALAKNRGFVYPGSEIYGGLANTWDYGNLGVELKNNVKKAWWQKFVQESPYNVGVDCAILMNSQTWVASGHLGGFSDPLMDCKQCKERFRADKLIEDYNAEHGIVPRGVKKEIRDIIDGVYRGPDVAKPASRRVEETDFGALDEKSLSARLKELEARMMDFARNLDFEKAAQVREEIKHLREQAFGASAEA